MQQLIHSYAKQRSNVAANRLVHDKSSRDRRTMQPVRYLDENFNELYQQFPFKDELSKSTFLRYIRSSGQYKKPHRLSDLCEYCEHVNILILNNCFNE